MELGIKILLSNYIILYLRFFSSIISLQHGAQSELDAMANENLEVDIAFYWYKKLYRVVVDTLCGYYMR